MSSIQTTAGALRPGMILHRVQPVPLSAVFQDAINLPVLSVGPHPDDPRKVRVVLDPTGTPARVSAVNLTPERVVYVQAPDDRSACDAEFGEDHEHHARECAYILGLMSAGYDDGLADALNREAEEESLGRPLFPNEY